LFLLLLFDTVCKLYNNNCSTAGTTKKAAVIFCLWYRYRSKPRYRFFSKSRHTVQLYLQRSVYQTDR